MASAVKRFSWNNPAVYPLIGALAIAVGVVTYSSARHFLVNPDVRVSKTIRAEAMADDEETARRAKAYRDSIFRSLGSVRSEPEKPPHTRIF